MHERPLLRTIWSMAIAMGLGNLFLPGVLWRLVLLSPFQTVQALMAANLVAAGVALLLGFAGSRNAVVRVNSAIAAVVLVTASVVMWYMRGQLAAHV